MQKLAWSLANPSVTELIERLIEIPDYKHVEVKITLRCRLSLADACILVQYLGVSKAADYIGTIDPWSYPENPEKEIPEIRHPPGIRRFIQVATDKATFSGRIFSKYTTESKTAYLQSPILVRNGDRPQLIRISRFAPSTVPEEEEIASSLASTPPLEACPSGTLLCLENTFFPWSQPHFSGPLAGNFSPPSPRPSTSPVSPAAEPPPSPIPVISVGDLVRVSEASPVLQGTEPPPSPAPTFFEGDLVEIKGDTTPGVHPVFAYGVRFAYVRRYAGGGNYFVSPNHRTAKPRLVPGYLLRSTCMEGMGLMYRYEGGGGSAAREIHRSNKRALDAEYSAEATNKRMNILFMDN